MSKKNKIDLFCLRSAEFRMGEARENGASSNDDGNLLYGYVAVFDVDTEINSWEGHFNERVSQGAFKKTLRENTPVCQFDHGHDTRTGSVPIGVFEVLDEDSKGLYVEAPLFKNDLVEPIRQAIAAGAIKGMSFRFKVVRDEWRDKDGKKITKRDDLYNLLWNPGDRGPLQRTIKEVKLYEAGPVVFPAYTQTSVGVRSAEQEPSFEGFEDLAEEERRQLVVDEYSRHSDFESDTDPEDADETVSEVAPEVRAEEPEVVTSKGHTKRAVPTWDVAKPREKKTPAVERKESVPMRTVEEMRARLAEIAARMTELDEEFRDAELPEERQAEWDGLETEGDSLRASIQAAESRAASLKKFVLDTPNATERGSDTKRSPALHVKKTDADLFDVDSLRMNSNSPEEFVESVRDNARRVAEALPVPLSSKRDASRERALELLEEFDTKDATLAKRFLKTGSKEYERAFGKAMLASNTMGLTADEQRALAVGADGTGGFMVPPQLDPTIVVTDSLGVSPIRRYARVEQITGSKWQGITSSGITVGRDLEAAEVSDDSPTFLRPEVEPERVQGFVPFSYEIDQDWGGLRAEIAREFGRAKVKEENTAFLTGDGVAPNPEGLLTGATNTVTTAGVGVFAVADLYSLTEDVAPEFRENGVFFGSNPIYNDVRQFGTSDGHALWERLGAGTPGLLLGKPAEEVSGMSGTVATGNKILLFGDVREAFIIVDRIGMSVELVPHLFGASRRPTGQRGIYVIWRNGSKVLRPNAVSVLVVG